MFLYENESGGRRAARLRDMAARVLHRLGDAAEVIWTREEVERYIRVGAKELADQCRMLWDQAYLENLPAAFSYTSRFEARLIDFDYGLGGYTFADEATFADEFLEVDEARLAYFTSPADLPFVEVYTIPALSEVPELLTDIDRATWDFRKIEATNHHRAHVWDSRYQITEGEVFAYIFQKEGPNTLRKVRVPAEAAWYYLHVGSWGVVRDLSDVSEEEVEGSWGIPRRIPGWHPMGWSEGFGTPRRFYRDERNFKLEFYREPVVDDMLHTDLPDQYFRYVSDYAQWKALIRNGEGQDFKLAQLYKGKWDRNLSRIQGRIGRQQKERTPRAGGDSAIQRQAPPRPRLPWQYGSQLR